MSRPPGSQDVEWLDLGPPGRDDVTGARQPRRPSRRLVIAAIAIALVAGAGITVGLVATSGGHSHHATSAPGSTQPGTANDTSADAPEVTATGVPRSGPPAVTSIGHSLLGVTDGWELFVRGDNVVARVQMAAGRVTVTPTPTLGTGGGVAFLVTRKAAFALPSDFVPGYTVLNGSAATLLTGGLANGGNVYPGPVDGQFWQQVSSQDIASAFELVDAAGRDLHRAITLPQSVTGPAISDGSGYLIVQGVSGNYDARPGSLRRITTGQITAVGPTEWLTEECDDVGQCSDVAVDKATWQRQVVGPSVASAPLAPGVISPDGSLAAVARKSPNRRFAVDLIEIATGAEHTVSDIPDGAFSDQTMAFSPDGRWLFVVRDAGAIAVINTETLQHTSLGVQLPPAVQVTVRAAPPR